MKVFTSATLHSILVDKCSVWASEATWGVCLLSPMGVCHFVWWSGIRPLAGISQKKASPNKVHIYTFRAHPFWIYGYRQLNSFHILFITTINNSWKICIYGKIKVETTSEQGISLAKGLRCGKRFRVKTSSYSLVKADALVLLEHVICMQNSGYIVHVNVITLIYFSRNWPHIRGIH